jgi:hypothetical protein
MKKAPQIGVRPPSTIGRLRNWRSPESEARKMPAMKRFRRWLFNGLALLSLALCLTTISVWTCCAPNRNPYLPFFHFGDVSVGQSHYNIVYEGPPNRPQKWTFYVPAPGQPTTSVIMSPTTIFVSCWIAAVTFAILPAIWPLTRRKRRFVESVCQKCGHDLRATPDRCPECGIVSQKAR